ncbi:MAG: radical SAM protein [Candidatus Brocadiia bacterium]|nr:radical SAM protein [Candidatus Brocadiia bacterium]
MSDGREPPGDGFLIVLTADRTLMADYRMLFDGMVGASQTTRTPRFLMKGLLAPPARSAGLRAVQAPLGLRRIEAALTSNGWNPDDVAVVRPEDLGRAVGPRTRIIGLSSGDPLGRGMNSSTMAAVAGGEIYTSRLFRNLTERVGRLRRRAASARVVVGGPGAWQLASDSRAARGMGIDHVVTGYCEGNVAALFRSIADGEAPATVLAAEGLPGDAVPAVRGATVMGSVEISRGCGLGCGFCTIAQERMIHVPAETVISDVETNLSAGVGNVSLVTEDVLRYGADGARPRPAALIDLLLRMRGLAGVGRIQADHANIASVERYTDEQLVEVRRLMAGQAGPEAYVWLNLGVETAAGELLRASGGGAKMGSCEPDEWGEFCLRQVRRLVQTGFFPLVSLMVGLPGEAPDDVEETIRWVGRLGDERLAVFPLLHAPVDGRSRPLCAADMSGAHWRLFRLCYRLNFRWVPRLYWENQSEAGAPLWRRLVLQAMGRGQALWWKGLFAWRSDGRCQ